MALTLSTQEQAALTEYQARLLGLTDPARREIVGMTFDLLMEYGVDISPTVISEDEFEDQPPLVQTIAQEGVELWTPGS